MYDHVVIISMFFVSLCKRNDFRFFKITEKANKIETILI